MKDAIALAEKMLSEHIEEYHDFEYEPHQVPAELASLRGIQHHLLGTLMVSGPQTSEHAMTDTVTSSRKVDRIMYVCTDCHDAGEEICCYADRRDLGVMPDGRWLCENCLSELPEKSTKGLECPPAYASAEHGTQDEGIDVTLTQLCKFLGVDQKSVAWDAATETVEGDVSAVIGNILRAKFGEDWGPAGQLVQCPTCARRFKRGENCDLPTCSLASYSLSSSDERRR